MTEAGAARPNRKPLGVVAWLLIALIGFAAVVGLLVLTRDKSPSGYEADNEAEAKAQCEGFADKRIKSPGSADYNLTAAPAGTGWVVTGTVDSQNSFGGSVRSDVRCELHFTGSTAHLDDISVG